MNDKSIKELLVILVLTVIFGVGAYFIGKTLDSSISEITSTRHMIDELTRYAVDKEARIEEFKAVSSYNEVLEGNLPTADEIINILEQLETMAGISAIQLAINLEEGVIGEGGIEFEDEQDKVEFLKNLEVKEYDTGDSSQTSDGSSGQMVNVALQLMEEEGVEEEEKLKINYIEMGLTLQGTYDQIRTFISLLLESKYFFNIKEVRLNKIESGQLEGAIQVRAFIFEK